MYRIVITQMVENPNWETKFEEWKKKDAFYNQSPMPEKYIEERSLEVTVTDEEFKAIKKATLEII